MATSPQSKDPKYRPYRVATYAVYLIVVCGFSLLVIVSVFRSAKKMTPEVPKRTKGPGLSTAQCVSRARGLWNDLEAERQHFSLSKNSEALQTHWQAFRLAWISRLRKAQAACGSGSDAAVRKVFGKLEAVENLYTTSAVQYGNEIAPAVADFRGALTKAEAGHR